VRTSLGNVAKGLHKSNDYSPENIRELVAGKITPAFRTERINNQVLAILKKGAAGMDELISRIGASQEEVQTVLDGLVKKGKVEEKEGSYSLAG